ncbi:MAG: hypothetical protein JW929_10660 [Anaerolineales bacterium]|nr:hypothetical protein [Anaerolineales bacterium]
MSDPHLFRPVAKGASSVLTILIGSILLHSCHASAAEKTAAQPWTPQPLAMYTLTAGDSPAPASTSDGSATQTALTASAAAGMTALEATAAAQTAFADVVLARIGEALGAIREEMGYGVVRWLHPPPVEVESADPSRIRFVLVDPALRSGDFALHTLVKWEAREGGAGPDCLVGFRLAGTVETDPWYSFRLSGNAPTGRVRFDFWRGGAATGTGIWTEAGPVRVGSGAENELILIARGNRFDAYVNGLQVKVWWNQEIARGGFGFGILPEAGGAVCSFRDNWIWEWV